MTVELTQVTSETNSRPGDPYVIVSTDSHAGPTLEGDLRPYCPPQYLRDYDEFAEQLRRARSGEGDGLDVPKNVRAVMTRPGDPANIEDPYHRERESARVRAWDCTGQIDPHQRIRDMDLDGVAADVVFSGGQNGEVLPFSSWGGFDQGRLDVDVEHRAVGAHIFNTWMADFISVEPKRHVGVIQITIDDIELAVKEVEWGRSAGLGAMNLPAPQRTFPAYTEPLYEPLWSACESLGLPLLTHVGGGERAIGVDGPMGNAMLQSEQGFMGRRGLWQLIFGGVFERHPDLKIVFTEQRQQWVAETLVHLDSVYEHVTGSNKAARAQIPRKPSEYWETNCFIGGSFMAPFEAQARAEVGVKNLMWGTDYPHMEGTWPHTALALRNTFSGVPEEDVRAILGDNAVRVYGLDGAELRKVADRIGPKPADVDHPLAPEEFPLFRGFAFRRIGAVS